MTGADPGTEFRGPHGEHGVRAYNWVLGVVSQSGPGAAPLVGSHGTKPPETEFFELLNAKKRRQFTANLLFNFAF